MAKRKTFDATANLFAGFPIQEQKAPEGDSNTIMSEAVAAEPVTSTPAPAEVLESIFDKTLREAAEDKIDIQTTEEPQDISNAPEPVKKIGRPASKDIKPDEIKSRTTIYLTEEMKYQIKLYGINHKMQDSEIIREAVRQFFVNNAD